MGSFERPGAQSRRFSARRIRRGVVVASIVALALAAIGSVASADAGKAGLFTFNPTNPTNPTSFPAGSTSNVGLTVKNESSQQQLGSANLTPPAGFVVTAAQPSTIASVDAVNNVVQLRNLSLAPLQTSPTITITLRAPCSNAGPKWTILAKQSNNFNGPPGNEVGIDPASNTAVTLTGGGCLLKFTGEPTDALTGTTITTDPVNPAGPPVAVTVYSGNTPVASSTAPITLSIHGSSPVVNLATVNAVNGVATFPGIKIVTLGDYQLDATSPGITSDTSTPPFTIWQTGTGPCTQCDLKLPPQKDETAEVTAASTSSGVLVGTLNTDPNPANQLNCTQPAGTTYQQAPFTTRLNSYRLTPIGNKVGTVSIAKNYVNQQANNGAAFYQVCYESPTAFKDRFNNTVNLGWLPDCKNVSNVPPCVQSITKDNAGNVLEKVLLPPGDPRLH